MNTAEIAIGEVVCIDMDGKEMGRGYDHVVIDSSTSPVLFNTAAFSDQGIKVVTVGDCLKVADISHATKTAYDAANAL